MTGQSRQRIAAVTMLVALSAMVLGACAPGGKVAAPDVKLPVSFELSRPADPATPQLADRWWTVFADPQLDALIDEALTRAPDARTALARLNEALAIRATALTAYGPQGALTAQGSDQHTKITYSGLNLAALGAVGGGSAGGSSSLSSIFLPADETKAYQGAFNVSWELDLFGRQKAARRAARADLLAARFDYEASRLSLAANVATALFQARALAVQLQDARETSSIADRLAAAGASKASRGLASESDSARLDADAETARADVERLSALTQAARRTLLVLVGHGAEPSDSLKIEPSLSAPPELPVEAPSVLLLRRPDVRQAEQKLRSAIGTLTLDRLALLPTLTLQPGGSLAHSEANYISKTSIWTLAAGATAPVLDRPRLIGVVRLQKARAEEASAAYELSIVNAYRDAENGLNQLAADRTRLSLLTKAEARAHFAFTANEKGYELGLVDLTTLLSAERSWLAARSSLTALKAGALTDAVSTIKALGGGWSGSPARVKG